MQHSLSNQDPHWQQLGLLSTLATEPELKEEMS